MKLAVVLVFLIATLIFTIDSAEGRSRGHRHGGKRHHYREPSSSDSSSESYEEKSHHRPSGRTLAAIVEDGPHGRGWYESLKDAASDLSSMAYDKVSNTDWKEVGATAWDKAQKIGAAALS